ncbi:membrane protein [Cupriavidus sp. HPC(L)]|uniref:hypothetical protein n=1 Tax=Cupriavidus sp. HPC(L) TaxID=1217418 RepID=UPI00029179D7|nr:hypothetical protein [Cupriavidus sp. HPC(L)]ESH86918.1 membrane protein [Cupriavidus sp. HPC(L)]
MFWLLYLLPATLAASKVGSGHGFFAGLATLIAVLVAQSVFLFWLSGRMSGVVATATTEETPRQRTPVPLQVGEKARFKRLLLMDGAEGRHDATRRLYEDLRATISEYLEVEAGRDGSDAAMVSSMELAAGHDATSHQNDALVVFRSRDYAWAGFRFGGESFRFSCWSISTIRFTDVLPAKGDGYYAVTLQFKASARNRPSETSYRSRGVGGFLILSDHPASRADNITATLREIAAVLGAKYEYQTTMNV